MTQEWGPRKFAKGTGTHGQGVAAEPVSGPLRSLWLLQSLWGQVSFFPDPLRIIGFTHLHSHGGEDVTENGVNVPRLWASGKNKVLALGPDTLCIQAPSPSARLWVHSIAQEGVLEADVLLLGDRAPSPISRSAL